MKKNFFKDVAAAALAQAGMLVPSWLPEGRREGPEWGALNPNRADNQRGSFKVNLQTGRWSDFASDGVAGGDLISLYAYLQAMEQGEACKELAQRMGITITPRDDARASGASGAAPAKQPRKSDWSPVVPVPAGIVSAPGRHFHRGEPEMRWAYCNAAGELLGYVYRFRTSDGGKEVLPLVFAQHGVTGERKWHWMQWSEPRPLYWPQFGRKPVVPARPDKLVLVVEGEKCADAAYLALAERADVCTWSGGSKAVDKADWSDLAGRKVFIWPDCDAKREPLSRDEKERAWTPTASRCCRSISSPAWWLRSGLLWSWPAWVATCRSSTYRRLANGLTAGTLPMPWATGCHPTRCGSSFSVRASLLRPMPNSRLPLARLARAGRGIAAMSRTGATS